MGTMTGTIFLLLDFFDIYVVFSLCLSRGWAFRTFVKLAEQYLQSPNKLEHFTRAPLQTLQAIVIVVFILLVHFCYEIVDSEKRTLKYVNDGRVIRNERLISSHTSTHTAGSMEGKGNMFYRYVSGNVEHENYIRVYVQRRDDKSIELRELPADRTKIFTTKGTPKLQTYNKIYHPVYSLLFERREDSTETIKEEYYRLYIPEDSIVGEYSLD